MTKDLPMRLPTGIAGLDEILGGGLIPARAYLLRGGPGTGKTTVLRTLLGQLDDASIRTALILNPCLSAPQLLASINREFGIAWEGLTPPELLDALNRFLLAENRAGRRRVLGADAKMMLSPSDRLRRLRRILSSPPGKI